MITPRQLTPLLLAIALGSTPLHAQPAAQKNAEAPASAPAEKTAPAKPAPTTQAPATPESAKTEPAGKNPAPDKGKDSPFEYHSSEEISEDLPVSFPVDI
jgi:hypothetical protein